MSNRKNLGLSSGLGQIDYRTFRIGLNTFLRFDMVISPWVAMGRM